MQNPSLTRNGSQIPWAGHAVLEDQAVEGTEGTVRPQTRCCIQVEARPEPEFKVKGLQETCALWAELSLEHLVRGILGEG